MQQSIGVVQHRALLELGRTLRARGFRFTTITPATHARVAARKREASDLRDVFGWSLPFRAELLGEELLELLEVSGCLEKRGGLHRSRVRFSSLGDRLYVHSAYPTTDADAVFFGPDTYRYANALSRLRGPFRRAVDVGAGSGAGLLSISSRCEELVFTDINDRALTFTAINAELAGVRAEVFASDVLRSVPGDFDLIVSNPPYLVDASARAYRHGGARGIELPARIVEESLPRLRPGGTLFLYTGTPVVGGVDLFRQRMDAVLRAYACEYEELDVDVFGEELDEPAYADVERISLVSLTARRRVS